MAACVVNYTPGLSVFDYHGLLLMYSHLLGIASHHRVTNFPQYASVCMGHDGWMALVCTPLVEVCVSFLFPCSYS